MLILISGNLCRNRKRVTFQLNRKVADNSRKFLEKAEKELEKRITCSKQNNQKSFDQTEFPGGSSNFSRNGSFQLTKVISI